MTASGNYHVVSPADADSVARSLATAWTAESIARDQRALADLELARFRAGQPVAPFDAFVALVRAIQPPPLDLLEVGCGSGYYAEVMQHAGLGGIGYTGADYSPPMIQLATERLPGLPFVVADACALPYHDDAFDLVVSGCVLVHLAEWRAAIREAARVSRRWVMLHRLQTVTDGPEQTFTKEAYGVPCFERWFVLRDVMSECEHTGLRLWRSVQIGRGPDYEIASYLMEKVG